MSEENVPMSRQEDSISMGIKSLSNVLKRMEKLEESATIARRGLYGSIPESGPMPTKSIEAVPSGNKATALGVIAREMELRIEKIAVNIQKIIEITG